jgi:glycosyl transferase family 25
VKIPNIFPPVFIISLPHETERQAKIAARLKKFGMAYQFFTATHKDALSADDRRFYNSRRRRLALGKDLYDAEIACMLSHKRVIEKIIEENISRAIVLEDDCVLCDEFPGIIAALLSKTDLWHLVRFFGNDKHERRRHRKLAWLGGGFSLVRIGTSPGEAHCYLLDEFAARNMAKALDNTSTPIDILMGQPWKTQLGVLTVYPNVAWQDKDFESGIGDERFSGKLHVTGLEKFIFRLLHPVYTMRNSIFKKLWFFAAVVRDWRTAHRVQS